MNEICCEPVKETSIADKEQAILSELREIIMKLTKIHSSIVGNERCVDENQCSPSCLLENVEMNMHLVSDINAMVNNINDILFLPMR